MGISVSGLSYSYDRDFPVLNDISFEIENGKLVCLLGPNGVGKSTLFKCMLGLLTGYSGEISINGDNIRQLSPRQLSQNVAYIPQSVLPSFNYPVNDVVLMGTTSLTGSFLSPGKREKEYVDMALDSLDIKHLRNRMFFNISGGERQLVLIARALAQQAHILFMDEPTANLDYGNQIRVMTRIKSLAQQGYTVVLSTHNPDQAFMYADKALAILDGRIAAYGPPNEVMDKDLLEELYNVRVSVESLYNDSVRICVPESVKKARKGL
ncbi:MAG: ABC transporter ATP-binding protein [Oscillospiraceae bacterium]|nr:ABC transporter ATP-binding protein [Oscillospiraceae bacterium]